SIPHSAITLRSRLRPCRRRSRAPRRGRIWSWRHQGRQSARHRNSGQATRCRPARSSNQCRGRRVLGLESDTLTGIVAAAGTPQAIIDKSNAGIVKMVADPQTKKKLDTLGFVPVANSPSEFAERIKLEMARWDKVVKTAGIHVD